MLTDEQLEPEQMTCGETLGWNAALEWAATWIENSAFGDQVMFARNMAMSIRANRKPVGQEDFFEAVRDDPDMTPEQKARWLALRGEG